MKRRGFNCSDSDSDLIFRGILLGYDAEGTHHEYTHVFFEGKGNLTKPSLIDCPQTYSTVNFKCIILFDFLLVGWFSGIVVRRMIQQHNAQTIGNRDVFIAVPLL